LFLDEIDKASRCFNPTMVRLLRRRNPFASGFRIAFNPTMVRLLPHAVNGTFSLVDHFQSHNGAIAAIIYPAMVGGRLTFQSHNGAIAAAERWGDWSPAGLLSIPQWCDCCP